MKKMKAIVKRAPEPGLRLEEVPAPSPGTNEALIRVRRASICGTDLHIYNWDEWSQKVIKPPLIIGHEFAGEVAEVGPGVARFKPGDRVTGEGHITCGVCRNCQAGKLHLCHRTQGIGVHRDGAFAEYLVMPESNLWPIHPDIPDEIAAFMDPLGNAVHCALSFEMVGEDVLITGAGPIGVMAAAICRFVGARHIVVTDRNDYRLELARRMGATRAIHIERASIEETMRELKMSNGFDIGLEMSGSPDAFRSMIDKMYNGGRIALLGFLPDSTRIDWNQVILKSLHLKGVYGREMYDTWYKMTQLLRSGLDVSPVLTHRLKFSDYERAFAILQRGESGKIVLEW